MGDLRGEALQFEAGQALMVAVDIPSRGTVTVANPKKPYLGIAIELDFAIMQAVAEEIEKAPLSGKPKARGAFVLDLDRQLVDCAQRAIRLLKTPEAIPTLYPGIMREVCYWLLTGPVCNQVSQIMIMANGHNQRIIRAIHTLRDKFERHNTRGRSRPCREYESGDIPSSIQVSDGDDAASVSKAAPSP